MSADMPNRLFPASDEPYDQLVAFAHRYQLLASLEPDASPEEQERSRRYALISNACAVGAAALLETVDLHKEIGALARVLRRAGVTDKSIDEICLLAHLEP